MKPEVPAYIYCEKGAIDDASNTTDEYFLDSNSSVSSCPQSNSYRLHEQICVNDRFRKPSSLMNCSTSTNIRMSPKQWRNGNRSTEGVSNNSQSNDDLRFSQHFHRHNRGIGACQHHHHKNDYHHHHHHFRNDHFHPYNHSVYERRFRFEGGRKRNLFLHATRNDESWWDNGLERYQPANRRGDMGQGRGYQGSRPQYQPRKRHHSGHKYNKYSYYGPSKHDPHERIDK